MKGPYYYLCYMSLCVLLIHHTNTSARNPAHTKAHAHSENHRLSPFPASWPASTLYCPALKRDSISFFRLLPSQKNEETSLLSFFSFFVFSHCPRSNGGLIPSSMLSLSTEQCGVTEGRLSEQDEKSNESAHMGSTSQSF